MTKYQKKLQKNKESIIEICSKNGWTLNRWGSLERTSKTGRPLRIKFKKLVLRYEALSESRNWVLLYTARLSEAKAFVSEEGILKFEGLVRVR